MRVIGVIDLAGGRAVHARHGVRARYAPVGIAAGCPIDGDPIALARTYVDRLGLTELYVADLDAITAEPRTQEPGASADALTHETLIASLATVAPLWLDAAISSPARARQALTLGATRAIVGLETLQSFDLLSAICAALGNTPWSHACERRRLERRLSRVVESVVSGTLFDWPRWGVTVRSSRRRFMTAD